MYDGPMKDRGKAHRNLVRSAPLSVVLLKLVESHVPGTFAAV